MFLAVPVLLVLVHSAFAQISGVGVRPGLTVSSYKLTREYNDLYDAGFQPGGSVGVFMEVNLGNRFTLQPEVVFTQRGAHLRSESAIYWDGPEFGYPVGYAVSDYRFRETLNYIDIPVMVEKNFGGGRFGGYVALGPGLSFGLNGRGKEEITLQYRDESLMIVEEIDRNEYEIEMGKGRYDMYRGFDFNINLGAGMLFLLDNGEIGLDLRYTMGSRGLDVNGLKNRNLLVGVSFMRYIGG
jgi:hypothetical protein